MQNNQTILMCPPEYFDIEYSINPWMHLEVQPETNLAQKQWQNLHNTIKSLGVDIKLITPQPKLPDLVFIDAGFLHQNIFIPSNFYYPERQGERIYFSKWFKENGYEILDIDDKFKFEGHGDNLWSGDKKVFCGYGFRSQKESFVEIEISLRQKLSLDRLPFEMILMELIDSRFYHLDTCFCPLNENQALYFPGAISQNSIQLAKKHIELFEVPEEEAIKFACNSLVLDKNIIIPANCFETNKLLKNLGYTVWEVEMTEFMKSGGACKCLSMPV